jgi:hypothetical protein
MIQLEASQTTKRLPYSAFVPAPLKLRWSLLTAGYAPPSGWSSISRWQFSAVHAGGRP